MSLRAASISAPIVQSMATPNVIGLSPLSLIRWRTALAKMLAGQGNARILCVGDSTTFGVGSNNANGTGGGNMQPLAWPTQLATILTNMGISANAHSIAGFGSISFEDRSHNDGRVTFGSSWTKFAFAANQSAGGCLAQATTNTNALSFLPTSNVDTFKIWGVKGGTNGVLSAAINAGTPTTHDFSGGALSIDSYTISGTLGANTLNLKWSSGGTVFVSAIESWNSATPQVCITNAGWSGAGIKDIDSTNSGSTGYDAKAFALAYAPDLYIVCVGINDWRSGGTGTSLATYTAKLQAFLTALQAVGDVILLTPAPSHTADASIATQQGFVAAMQSIAANLGIPLIDVWNRWGPWSNNSSMYATYPGGPGDLHPIHIGYADIARTIARVLGTA